MCKVNDMIGCAFTCITLEDTAKAARQFSNLACVGSCFALYGDLGYGKTTFTKYFIQSINPTIIDVSSPTFTIVQIYDTQIYNKAFQKNIEIWHVDCYRLKSEDEFFELGLEEAFQSSITIIEWPEIIQHLLPKNTIRIKFSLDICNNNSRIISCF